MTSGRLTGPPVGASWSVEIQIHPSDIRKRVRYLFLTRLQVTVLSIVALLYLLLLALAAAVAPGVLGGLLNRQEYFALAAERGSQGQRLQALVGRLEQLETRARRLDLGVGQVLRVYSLPRVARTGGGAPFRAAPLADSIYAGAVEQGQRLSARIGIELAAIDAVLRGVQDFERQHPDVVRTTPSLCPLRGELVLISSFRSRRSPYTKELEFHPELDLAAPAGTPIRSPADGVVTFAGRYPMARSAYWWRLGNLVAVANGGRFVTLFGHCDVLRVRAGQSVRRGDVLATVGNTGWSLSPHVHYEIRRREGSGELRPIDPLLYILDRRWPNEERQLFGGRNEPPADSYEPLPPGFAR